MRIRITVATLAASLTVLLAACGGSGSASPVVEAKSKEATSAADFGGQDKLIEAAKKEGTINVIALPDDWANYGKIKKAFTEKYGIKVNSILPDASSKEEIAAAEQNKGTANAPDVFDLGTAVALDSTRHFAPYKVTVWEKIPTANKEATGRWVNDYTGIMSVGYNATKFGEITSLEQLTDPKFKSQVALNGKPAEAGAAFNGFLMVNATLGGSFTNLQPGLDYFGKLSNAGTLNQQDVTAGTIDSGTHGVVFDWSYNQVATQARLKEKGVEWKVFVPKNGEIAAFYNQAINIDAPHPAAARLWMEFLYSPEVQNLWLAGGARPVLFESMKAAGSLDANAANNLPPVSGNPKTPTVDEAAKITEFLKEKWNSAVS